ncbi:GntR family transcriptional regulator [Desulfotignum phosphitoxidans]|jgi:DNA-binding GntR family transcriptional regulator|uniref:Putative HTH-type transcriptional regulator, GntR family n=1 Tax=Desulfotignum phosphitoxidans DSM 13687 TaxID=1286635 RepID=S0G5U1_9BACT|nr:GntR family transcriptional regulator [Desulfotignum phosphitoxidans]EMS79952.1 putative HTH-type transcriptional regulator, GntR family [Desulfotignum phosphitoxidans DSM 13687]
MVQTQTTQNKSDLTFKAYMAIRQMLFYNEIQPGQKIKYKDLATRIGVSMTPVIQALKWLEFHNIVRHESNKGYYINEVSVKEITEVYDTRLLLEVSLVPGIIGHLNDQGIRKLAATLDDYKAAVAEDNYHKRIMTDMKFHMTLAALSKCHIQVKMLQELFDILLLRYNQNLFYLSMTGTSLAEHEDIFNSIKKRDQVRLEASLKFHVDTVRNHITKGMSRLVPDKKESF